MSKRPMNGMHQSNGPQWDVEKYLESAPGCVTLLHFQMKDDPTIQQNMDHENQGWFVKLRDGWPDQGIPAAPERLIHVRTYHPNWTELKPVEWARHIVRFLSEIKSGSRTYNLWEDPLVCVSPANEQNLHYECGQPDASKQWMYQTVGHYQKIAAWNKAFADEVNRLVPNRKALLCWPALAFGHEPNGFQPDGEYTIPEIREAMEAYEILASHPYALLHTHGPKTAPGGDEQFFFMLRDFRPAGFDNLNDPGGILAQIPDKPLLISETGTFVHSDPSRTAETLEAFRGLYRAAAASGRVIGITPFVWHSDGAHPGNTIWPNESLRNAVPMLHRYMTAAEIPVAGASSPAPPAPEEVVHPTDQLYLDRLRARLGPDRVHLIRDQVRSRYRDVPHFNFRRRAGGPDAVEAIVQHHSAADIDADAWDLWDFAVHNAPWRDSAGRARRGWDTISYGTVIDRDGVVWIGALPGDFSWHTGGQNGRSYGVVIPGNFVNQTPSDASLESMRHVHAALRESIGLDRQTFGHAEMPGQATVCPGDHLLPHVVDMRENGDVGGVVEDGTAALVAKMRERQEVTPNPSASLQRAAADDGYTVLLGDEFPWAWGGSDYVAQGVADIRTGRERVYVAPVTDFNDVRSVDA